MNNNNNNKPYFNNNIIYYNNIYIKEIRIIKYIKKVIIKDNILWLINKNHVIII